MLFTEKCFQKHIKKKSLFMRLVIFYLFSAKVMERRFENVQENES